MKAKPRHGSRRNFLKQLMVTGWVGALATLDGKPGSDGLTPDGVPETAAGTSRGYRETSHVRKYYEKASR